MSGKIDTNLLSNFTIDGAGGGFIKSIQRGSANMSTLAQLNVSISSVDTTKAVVRIGNANASGSDAGFYVEGSFLNSTTIQLNNNSPVGGTYLVDWEVIEFNNVKSLQSGLTQLSGVASVNVTVTSINTANAMIFYASKSTNTASTAVSGAVTSVTIQSNTQINIRRGVAGNDMYTRWFLVEFN